MIKANEFRIGNWAYSKTYATNIQFKSFFGLCNAETNPELYNPIPLTAEILEKCGFEKCGLLNSKRQCIKWENDFFYIYCDGENFNWEQVRDEFGSMIEGVELKYLHQLQNLFFAITNEEINFTP